MELKFPKLSLVMSVQKVIGIDIFDKNTAKMIDENPMYIVKNLDTDAKVKQVCDLIYVKNDIKLDELLPTELGEDLVRFFTEMILEGMKRRKEVLPSEVTQNQAKSDSPQEVTPLIPSSSASVKEDQNQ